MSEQDPISVANRWIKAYNEYDFDTIRELCAPDIKMEHHNRGATANGADEVIGLMEAFKGMVTERGFHDTRRQFTDGERVVTEQSWTVDPTVDLPGFTGAGERLTLELCCVWTVRNGQIHEYDDYG